MFEFAVASGPRALAGSAAYFLGRISEVSGDPDGARPAYQLAVDSGNPEAARLAAEGLARLTPKTSDPS